MVCLSINNIYYLIYILEIRLTDALFYLAIIVEPVHEKPNEHPSIGTASANSAKFRGIRPRMYIEDLL